MGDRLLVPCGSHSPLVNQRLKALEIIDVITNGAGFGILTVKVVRDINAGFGTSTLHEGFEELADTMGGEPIKAEQVLEQMLEQMKVAARQVKQLHICVILAFLSNESLLVILDAHKQVEAPLCQTYPKALRRQNVLLIVEKIREVEGAIKGEDLA